MVDLGKHASDVLAAYGVSAFLILVLVISSIRAARRSRKRLAELEAKD